MTAREITHRQPLGGGTFAYRWSDGAVSIGAGFTVAFGIDAATATALARFIQETTPDAQTTPAKAA